MSSARSADLFEFYNVGALTTTFTAPAACSSLTRPYRGVEYPGLPGQFALGLGSCSSTDWAPQCTPNGEAVSSLYQSWSDKYENAIPTYYVDFYSPGLACPSAWETVGVISSRDGSLDASGVFASTAFQYQPNATTSLPPQNFAFNALTSVLGPSETALVCCPSGFTIDPFSGCYSNIELSDLAGETACATVTEGQGYGNNERVTTVSKTFEYFGQTITNDLYFKTTLTGSEFTESYNWTKSTKTITYTVNESGVPNNTQVQFVEVTGATDGLEYLPYLLLVNSGEQSEGGGGGESGAQSRVVGSVTVASVVAALWAVGFLGVCSL